MSLIEIKGLQSFYGDMQALFGVDLALDAGECLALVGANGAGKSTLLRSITGLIGSKSGRIAFNGDAIDAHPAEAIARMGIAMVPEGRMLFPSLTVEENLLIGGNTRRPGRWSLEQIFRLFPILKERRRNPATTLSGGQQQMVAIGRALMSNPRVLLCDEISLGLAPIVIQQIYDSLAEIRSDGTAVVIVEQDITRAASVADRVVCLLRGKITLEQRAGELDMDRLNVAYFGAA